MDQIAPADDLSSFLEILPPNIRETLGSDTVGLYEVVLNLAVCPRRDISTVAPLISLMSKLARTTSMLPFHL